MVFSRRAKASLLKYRPDDYILVDASMDTAHDQREKIEMCIDLVMTMQFIYKCNKLAKAMGSDEVVETEIFGEAIGVIFSKHGRFSDEQLLRYFHAKDHAYLFIGQLSELHDTESYYFPPTLDFILLGASPEKAIQITIDDPIHEAYDKLHTEMDNADMDVPTFITKAKHLIEGHSLLDFK